ncbi:MAG: sugar transporter permease, partial [Microbacteriaceae bacterium]|nr:sugar transporter permease [Microbacteriaceae bacterium]
MAIAAPARAHTQAKVQAHRKKRGSSLPVFLVAPAVVLLLLFTIAPAIYAIDLSFLRLKISGGLLGT